MDPMTADLLGRAELTVARAPQARGTGAALDVYDSSGVLGRFVETTPEELEGASVIDLADAGGRSLLSVLHPGHGARARVDVGGGSVGFVSRVGRVRANFEIHGPGRRPEGEALAVLRPLDDGDGWQWHEGGTALVDLRWWLLGSPSEDAYGEARYTLRIDPGVEAAVRPLLIALPVVVDRSFVQVVSGVLRAR
jgi:hypothetical protein